MPRSASSKKNHAHQLITSRRFVAAAATLITAAIALTGCAGSSSDSTSASAGASTSIAFQLDWVKDSEFAGMFVADKKGYYSADGLAVNFLDGSNVDSTAAVIASGAAQIGIVSNMSRLADAQASGADLVVVGAVYQTSPAGFMTLPSVTVKSVNDLKGLRIGSDASGQADIDTLFKVNGESPDYTPVQVGYDAAPLFQGQIDAYYVYLNSEPIPYQLKGTAFNTVTFDSLGYKSYAGLIVTTRSFLDSNRAAVVNFVSATQKGWADALADPASAAATTIADYGSGLGLDQATQVATIQAQAPLMNSSYTAANGLLALDPAAITGPMNATLTAGGKTIPPQSVYDYTVVSDAKAASK
ncbi:ABC transporter substrate-binding protein [Subtercola endophyticus]|uniref:ABC transporter substrate-binding protein n=1 Tax=Subtercola endophyticus TaxID=2895559 RepID=UPI001E5605A8|nr:ABC transporter substrate-binding protein [Subtercola endophyticus]UFS60654.1 ABC transporter substrate-binding protein [Subtercola endophyticus]